jgi:GNAT superfamily N-acetyltransferase
MNIRHLTHDDIPQVLRVQEDAYKRELLECAEIFSRKLLLFPRGCLGHFEDAWLEAYVFSHPWNLGQLVPLDHSLAALPESPDCLYIHDLAVCKDSRGKGLARRLVLEVFQVAEKMRLWQFALVAVQDSEPFWENWGFQRREKLMYAENISATYMTLVRGRP